jgi:biopolymer transport protein ExbD
MGEIIVEETGKKGGKRKAKKHSTRIDMTPMVDLMCLLITFFMLTTAFSKPKVMVITMPEKDTPEDKNRPEIPKNRTLNILLTEGHKTPRNLLKCRSSSKPTSVKMGSESSY